MRKVLVVGNDISVKGGIGISIKQILDYDWSSKGIKMSYIPTYNDKNKLYMCLFFSLACIRIFFKFLFDKPDVVHVHMSYRGSFTRKYLVQMECNLFHIPVIIHLHGSEFEKWYDSSSPSLQKRIRRLMKNAATFIVLGEKWKSVALRIEPKTKVEVVYNAVAIPDAITEWNPDVFQVLFMGVLIKRKGVMDLIEAFYEACKKANTHIKLVMTGVGEEENHLRDFIKTHELDDKVELVGWISDEEKRQLLKSSQLFVLPSYNEGMPRAILEAMSYGLPIIATDVGDVSTTVKDGLNGYLVQPGDVDSLAERIAAIATNKELCTNMGIESRKLTEAKFSDTVFFDTLEKYYKEV